VNDVRGFSGAETKHMNVKSKKNQRLFYKLALLEDGDVTSHLLYEGVACILLSLTASRLGILKSMYIRLVVH